MAYCTEADIELECQVTIASSGTRITSTQITELIAQADATINGMIDNRYQTPITASEALSIVKQISIQLVSARVRKILAVKSGIPDNEQDSQTDEEKIAFGKLKLIQNGMLKLTDASLAQSGNGFKSYTNDYSSTAARVMEVGTDQW